MARNLFGIAMPTWEEAALLLFAQTSDSMDEREIASRIVERGFRDRTGETPDKTVGERLRNCNLVRWSDGVFWIEESREPELLRRVGNIKKKYVWFLRNAKFNEPDNSPANGMANASIAPQIIAPPGETVRAKPNAERALTRSKPIARTAKVTGQPKRLLIPEEVDPRKRYLEGSVMRVALNRYERNPKARAACIAHHGSSCVVCKFDFAKAFGPEARGYIHVHHLREISKLRGPYKVDPVADLRPVCPNCHAMLHLSGSMLTPDQLRSRLRERRAHR
jgi:hypothetical protein